jgi:hypothetical protein
MIYCTLNERDQILGLKNYIKGKMTAIMRSATRRVGESTTLRLGESGSRHGESGRRYSKFFKFNVNFPNFKRLNQPFKGPI